MSSTQSGCFDLFLSAYSSHNSRPIEGSSDNYHFEGNSGVARCATVQCRRKHKRTCTRAHTMLPLLIFFPSCLLTCGYEQQEVLTIFGWECSGAVHEGGNEFQVGPSLFFLYFSAVKSHTHTHMQPRPFPLFPI